jgi:hypothetical protein
VAHQAQETLREVRVGLGNNYYIKNVNTWNMCLATQAAIDSINSIPTGLSTPHQKHAYFTAWAILHLSKMAPSLRPSKPDVLFDAYEAETHTHAVLIRSLQSNQLAPPTNVLLLAAERMDGGGNLKLSTSVEFIGLGFRV